MRFYYYGYYRFLRNCLFLRILTMFLIVVFTMYFWYITIPIITYSVYKFSKWEKEDKAKEQIKYERFTSMNDRVNKILALKIVDMGSTKDETQLEAWVKEITEIITDVNYYEDYTTLRKEVPLLQIKLDLAKDTLNNIQKYRG